MQMKKDLSGNDFVDSERFEAKASPALKAKLSVPVF